MAKPVKVIIQGKSEVHAAVAMESAPHVARNTECGVRWTALWDFPFSGKVDCIRCALAIMDEFGREAIPLVTHE